MSEEQSEEKNERSDPRGESFQTVGQHRSNSSSKRTSEKFYFVIIGVCLITVSPAVSVLYTVQDGLSYMMLRGLFAIGGGLVAGGIVGYLHVENRWLRGSGGFAVFILLMYVNPPAMVAIEMQSDQRKEMFNEVEAAATPSVQIDQMGLRDTEATSHPAPIDLNVVARDLGFSNFKHLKVTASESDLDRLRARIH